MTSRAKNAERRSKGLIYALSTGALFVALVALADSECRLVTAGTLTADCVSHVANSATVSAAYAAVYGIFAPQAFRAVFGRLIEVIIRIWAQVMGRSIPAAGTSRASSATPAAPPPRPAISKAAGAARWALPRETLLKALCAVVFVGLVVALVVKPPTPLPRGGVTGSGLAAADDQKPRAPPAPKAGQIAPAARPTTHTVIPGDTCVDIAKAYCTEAHWPEFQRHNGIRIVMRNGWRQCVLRPGTVYELPPEWDDESCNPPPADGVGR